MLGFLSHLTLFADEERGRESFRITTPEASLIHVADRCIMAALGWTARSYRHAPVSASTDSPLGE